MSWQNCPHCNGYGYEAYRIICTVCAGKRIINEQTGKPPEDKPSYIEANYQAEKAKKEPLDEK